MLIYGMIAIQDIPSILMNAPRERLLRSCLLTKKMSDSYYISVKNSKYRNCIDYKLSELDTVYTESKSIRKVILLFKEPLHQVLVKCDSVEMKKMLIKQLRDILNGKNLKIAPREMPESIPKRERIINNNNIFSLRFRYRDTNFGFNDTSPGFNDNSFVGLDRFDHRILDMKHLNILILERCEVPTLPIEIGQLPIKTLSLSGSKLALLQNDRDTFWDWMTENTICKTLITLKMDSVGLQTLPFEILYLRELKTLSLNKNKLTYLPPYIGELKKLENLGVANNGLNYIPSSMYSIGFNELDICRNPFTESDFLSSDHIYKYFPPLHAKNRYCLANKSVVKSLVNLSLDSLLDNCVKFKRQDIPRSLWHYFNVIGRCVNCNKFLLPKHCTIHHNIVEDTKYFPDALFLLKSPINRTLRWQSMKCINECVRSNPD